MTSSDDVEGHRLNLLKSPHKSYLTYGVPYFSCPLFTVPTFSTFCSFVPHSPVLHFTTPCKFVLHFHVLHFHVMHFQRPRAHQDCRERQTDERTGGQPTTAIRLLRSKHLERASSLAYFLT